MARSFTVDITTYKYLDASSTAKEKCHHRPVSVYVHVEMPRLAVAIWVLSVPFDI